MSKAFNEIQKNQPCVAETKESDDWLDVKVDDVSVEGVPLDGHYLDHIVNDL